ncbi:MAG: von Willebrand factor type A domain-containing protein, partial [Ferruginibacter sp.]
MKQLALYFITLPFSLMAYSQFYLRGEVKNVQGRGIQNVQIFSHTNRANYYSGAGGSFGITVASVTDTLTLSLAGYELQTIQVKSDAWQQLIMKPTSAEASKGKPRLISVMADSKNAPLLAGYAGDETYFQLVENEYVQTSKYPFSNFSLNVNKASYSNVRRFLNMNSPVPPDAVRIEEMVNYFNLYYHPPPKNEIFKLNTQLTSCPWNANEQLLFVNISAKKLSLQNIPPGNFVFLIDVSGSMDMPNRLPILQAAFQLLVKNLRAVDKVSIVTYGGTVGVWLAPTSGAEKDKINASIESLTAAGDTPGESAIKVAYK